MLGIGETASSRCLTTPTQLTTYSGRKADNIASERAKVRHIDPRDNVVALEQFDRIQGRVSGCPSERYRTFSQNAPEHRNILCPSIPWPSTSTTIFATLMQPYLADVLRKLSQHHRPVPTTELERLAIREDEAVNYESGDVVNSTLPYSQERRN